LGTEIQIDPTSASYPSAERRYDTGRQSAIVQHEAPLPGRFSDSNHGRKAGSASAGGSALVRCGEEIGASTRMASLMGKRNTASPRRIARDARAMFYRRSQVGVAFYAKTFNQSNRRLILLTE